MNVRRRVRLRVGLAVQANLGATRQRVAERRAAQPAAGLKPVRRPAQPARVSRVAARRHVYLSADDVRRWLTRPVSTAS